VFNVFTADDPELPRELVVESDGTDRFRKYLPKDRSFVNTIENYPYPYVIGRLCWQFPCMTPSDWQAQHLHKPNNPQTVKDWQAALDCTVIKKGVMTMVFHPHGWIKNDQLVELVDYADKKYGKRVKFLNFREALERLRDNLLNGHRLRDVEEGTDNTIRVLDVDNNGYVDVLVPGVSFSPRMTNQHNRITRLWSPLTEKWGQTPFPFAFELWGAVPHEKPTKVQCFDSFGVLTKNGFPAVYVNYQFFQLPDHRTRFGRFDGKGWIQASELLRFDPTTFKAQGITQPFDGNFVGWMRDIDGDGQCEFLCFANNQIAILQWSQDKQRWFALPFTLPRPLHSAHFIDLDGDGKLDLIFSNETEYGVYLFKDMKEGWSRKVIAGKAGEPGALPMISNNGENMGFFVHSGHLWWSNETTALLKDHVARISIKELLASGGR
jgi:hypothetical protein